MGKNRISWTEPVTWDGVGKPLIGTVDGAATPYEIHIGRQVAGLYIGDAQVGRIETATPSWTTKTAAAIADVLKLRAEIHLANRATLKT